MSKAVKLMAEQALTELLAVSRDWNTAHDLTGMLLYVEGQFINFNGGRFIQVIEGNEKEVKEIFQSIQKDPKHYHVISLNEGYIKNRNFENWSMGFQTMNADAYRKLPGRFELNDEVFDLKNKNSLTLQLISFAPFII